MRGSGRTWIDSFRYKPGQPTGYEWEAISLPMIHGWLFNELFPTRYAAGQPPISP